MSSLTGNSDLATYWAMLVVVGAAAAGIIAFIVNLQTVRNNIAIGKKLKVELQKLEYEVENLKNEKVRDSFSHLIRPTAAEIRIYGANGTYLERSRTRITLTSTIGGIAGILAILGLFPIQLQLRGAESSLESTQSELYSERMRLDKLMYQYTELNDIISALSASNRDACTLSAYHGIDVDALSKLPDDVREEYRILNERLAAFYSRCKSDRVIIDRRPVPDN